MADPLTSTRGLAVPTRGSDSGTWDVPVNNDMIAIDGMFGGVQSISLTNANVTLTVPATFSQTPGAGPTQPVPRTNVQKRVKCTRTRKVPGESACRVKDS